MHVLSTNWLYICNYKEKESGIRDCLVWSYQLSAGREISSSMDSFVDCLSWQVRLSFTFWTGKLFQNFNCVVFRLSYEIRWQVSHILFYTYWLVVCVMHITWPISDTFINYTCMLHLILYAVNKKLYMYMVENRYKPKRHL